MFGGIPFEWSDGDKRMLLSKSRVKIYKWYLGMTLMTINNIFVVTRCIQATCCMDVSYGKWFITLFSAVTVSTCTILNINYWIHRREIPEFVNQLSSTNGESIFLDPKLGLLESSDSGINEVGSVNIYLFVFSL
jgi:hypothetical protein